MTHSENDSNVPSQTINTSNKLIRTKLYVSKFPEHCTRRNLTEFFSQFGQVQECAIMWNKYAFIHYNSVEEAQHAMKLASKERFMGRKLHIQLSTSSNRQSCDWYQKEAEKLLLTGEEENESDGGAGHCVETKLYVTNLPEMCTQETLRDLFGKYGEVLECVIMWNHYAFVHYSSLEQAKRAVKNLHGYCYSGKKLVVQLSTSSNRPLPKCIALKSKSLDSIDDLKSQKLEKEECLVSQNEENRSVDWIRALQSGSVPVINPCEAVESNKTAESADSKLLIKTDRAQSHNLSGKLIDLAAIPTPSVMSGMKMAQCSKQPTVFESPDESLHNAEKEALSSDEEINKAGRDHEQILLNRLNLLKLNNDTDNHLKSIWLGTSYTRSSSSSGVYSRTPSPVFSPELSNNTPSLFQATSGTIVTSIANDLTIDYLNQKCVYPENMIEKREPVAPFCSLPTSSNSYILFPELENEQLDDNLVDYEKTLMELLRKSCEI